MKSFRKKEEVSLREFVVKSIANILNEDFDISLIDPQRVLSTAEGNDVIQLGKPFAIAMLFRATLKEVEAKGLIVSSETLVEHFIVGTYVNYRDNQVPDLDATSVQMLERSQQFIQDAGELVPKIPNGEATLESVFGTVFAGDVLPDCNVKEPLPQKKFATVLYFAITLQESLNKDVHAFFDHFTVTV
jgi:hypothetical protein